MQLLRLLATAMLCAVLSTTVAFGKDSSKSSGSVRVKGYYRKDGTYVAPHNRSRPNSTKADNWSTSGNVNPYTGKEGTKNIDSAFIGSIAPVTPPAKAESKPEPQGESLMPKTEPKAKGSIHFSKYDHMSREELMTAVTELEAKNASLEARLADLESRQH